MMMGYPATRRIASSIARREERSRYWSVTDVKVGSSAKRAPPAGVTAWHADHFRDLVRDTPAARLDRRGRAVSVTFDAELRPLGLRARPPGRVLASSPRAVPAHHGREALRAELAASAWSCRKDRGKNNYTMGERKDRADVDRARAAGERDAMPAGAGRRRVAARRAPSCARAVLAQSSHWPFQTTARPRLRSSFRSHALCFGAIDRAEVTSGRGLTASRARGQTAPGREPALPGEPVVAVDRTRNAPFARRRADLRGSCRTRLIARPRAAPGGGAACARSAEV
jgi:hypothetical protein